MVDYTRLRVSTVNTPEYRHVWLLLYWPIYIVWFVLVERVIPQGEFHVMWCPLDDLIPFHELAVIPYCFWYVMLVFIAVYLLLNDVPAFKRYMYFTILTYSASLIFFDIYPTCQNLRPESFERSNVLTAVAAALYGADTSTNVCPSLHVVGAFAITFGALDTKRFQTVLWRIAYLIFALAVSISTLFMKQHSAIDVAAGLLTALAGWLIVYGIPKWRKQQ